jgi:hypothetical protein
MFTLLALVEFIDSVDEPFFLSNSFLVLTEFSKGLMIIGSNALISQRQNGQLGIACTSCQLSKQLEQIKCPHGSNFLSLLFAAQILHT